MHDRRILGKLPVDGHEYIIVNKEGKDIFQLSAEAEKAGRQKAIEAGEPCDLCRLDFVPLYRKLGRDRFLEILRANQHTSDKAESLEFLCGEDKHWQDVRERAAIAAMQGLLCAPIIEGVNPNPSRESVAEWAVIQADALIEQLKKNNYGGKKKDRLEKRRSY